MAAVALLSASCAAALAQNSAPVSFDRSEVHALERGTEGTPLTVRIGNALDRGVSIKIAVTRAPGTSTGDYTISPRTVTFAAGSTEQTVTVRANTDAESEQDKRLTLTLPFFDVSALSGGHPIFASVTLHDTDSVISAPADSLVGKVRVGSYSAYRHGYATLAVGFAMGEIVTNTADFGGFRPEVRLLEISRNTVRIELWPALGSKTNRMPDDVSAIALSIGDHDFDLALASRSGSGFSWSVDDATAAAVSTTLEPGAVVDVRMGIVQRELRFAAKDYEVREGATVTVTVGIDQPFSADHSVRLHSGRSPGIGFDAPARVTFLAGEVYATFTAGIRDNDAHAPGQSVVFSVNAGGAILPRSPSSVTVTVIEDDPNTAGVSGPVTVREGESATYRATLEAPLPEDTWAMLSGSTGGSVLVRIPAGDVTSADALTVATAAGDAESVGSVTVSVVRVSGAPEGREPEIDPDGAVTTRIADPSIRVSLLPERQPGIEHSSVHASVTVSLSRAPGQELRVSLRPSAKGGANENWFTLSERTVTFAAGDTRKSVSISVSGTSGDGRRAEIRLDDLPEGLAPGDVVTATVDLIDSDYPVRTSHALWASTFRSRGFGNNIGFRHTQPMQHHHRTDLIDLQELSFKRGDRELIVELGSQYPTLNHNRDGFREWLSLFVGDTEFRFADSEESGRRSFEWDVEAGSDREAAVLEALAPDSAVTARIAASRHTVYFPEEDLTITEGGPPLSVTLTAVPPVPVALTSRYQLRASSGSNFGGDGSARFGQGASTASIGVNASDDGSAYVPDRRLSIIYNGSSSHPISASVRVGGGARIRLSTALGLYPGEPSTKTVGIVSNASVTLAGGGTALVTTSLYSDDSSLAEGAAFATRVDVSFFIRPDAPGSIPILQDGTLTLATLAFDTSDYYFRQSVTLSDERDNIVRDRRAVVSIPASFAPENSLTYRIREADFATLSLRRTGDAGAEGETVTVEASLGTPVDSSLTVGWALTTGSGDTGGFSEDSGSLLFRPLVTRQTFTVAVPDDDVPELGDTWGIDVTSVSGRHRDRVTAPGDVAGVTGAVAASDLMSLALSGPADVAEGSDAVYTVSVAGGVTPAPVGASLNFAGTADRASDYDPPPASVSIGAGESVALVTVSTERDSEPDPGETILVVLSEASGGGPTGISLSPQSRVTTTITEPNSPPAFSAADVTVAVDENRPPGSTLEVELTATDPDGDALRYSATGGSALGVDPGTGSVTVAGAALDHETRQSHTLTVSVRDGKNSSGGGDESADDTATVTVSVANVVELPPAPEGLEAAPSPIAGGSVILVSWTLPDAPGIPPVTGYSVEHAPEGSPFAPVGHAGTFPYAEIRGLEPGTGHRVRVRASNPDGDGPYAPAVEARTEARNGVRFADDEAVANEGSVVTLTVSMDEARTAATTVTAALHGVSAGSGDHSPGDSLTFSIAAGGTGASATVSLVQDSEDESPETFEARLDPSLPADLTLGMPSAATVTILEAEAAAESLVLVGLDGPAEVAAGVGQVTLTLSLGGGARTERVTATFDRTGSGAALYASMPGSVHVDAGQPAAHVAFAPDTAAFANGSEIPVGLSGVEGGGAGVVFDTSGAVHTFTVVTPNARPEFPAMPVTVHTVGEDLPSGSAIGDPYTAADPEDDALAYTLGGDSGLFGIGGDGQLSLGAAAALDSESSESHTLTVRVSDGKDGIGVTDESADDSLVVTVSVTDVDEPPPALPAPTVTAAASGGNTVLFVRWDAPSHGRIPAVSGYDVRYREGGGGFVSAARNTSATSVLIGGLDPGTEHQVQVRAKNDEGDGEWSPAGTGSTDPNLPPSFATGSASFSVAEDAPWGSAIGAPLVATDPNADPVSYSLAGPDTDQLTLLADNRLGVAAGSGLDHEAKGELTVTVLAGDGHSETLASISVTVTVTDVPEVPDAPDAPAVEPGGPDRIVVSWSPATTGDQRPITLYDIEHSKGGALVGRETADGSETSVTITGLEFATSYEARVRARNAAGAGGWSAAGAGSTDAPFAASMAEGSVTVAEGGAVSLTVSVAPPPTDALTVTLTLSAAGIPGTDAAGSSDYQPQSAEIGMTAGQAAGSVALAATEDTVPERDEALVARISGVSSAGGNPGAVGIGADDTTTVTILANDTTAFSLSGPADIVKGGHGEYTVAVSGDPLAADTSVGINAAGSADAGTDYTAPASPLAVAAGAASATFTVATSGDAPDNAGDTIIVSLGDLSGAGAAGVLLEAGAVTSTIVVPNLPPVAPAVTSFSAAESAPPGTEVGEIGATDPEGDAIVILLSGPGSELFGIRRENRLVVADGAALDFESAEAHTLTVSARDGLDARGLPDPRTDVTALVTVRVEDVPEPPSAPTGLGAGQVGRTAITVTWTAPADPGAPSVTGYDVEHRRSGEPGGAFGTDGVTHAGTETSATVGDLLPGNEIVVRVRARNSEDTDGSGAVTAPWATLTATAAANSAPSFPAATVTLAIDENRQPGAFVQGSSDADDADGDGLVYSLTQGGGDTHVVFGTQGAGGQITVSTGSPDHEAAASHTVTLRATDTFGAFGELTVVIDVNDADEPPAKPVPPVAGLATEGGETAISVSWVPPDADGIPEIAGHDVRHRARDEGGEFTVTRVPGTATSAAIALGGETTLAHEVQVRAYNDEGEGPWSDSGIALGIDPRMDGDPDYDHTDALLAFYSLRFGNFLVANERLLLLVFGRLTGPGLGREEALAIVEKGRGLESPSSPLDVDGDSDYDHTDALLTFYSLRFGNFLVANERLLLLVFGRLTRPDLGREGALAIVERGRLVGGRFSAGGPE